MLKKTMPLFILGLIVLSLAAIYGCGSNATGGGGGGGSSPITSSTLTISVEPIGWGTVEPHGGTYVTGTTVEITATQLGGHVFASWEGDFPGTTSPVFVYLNGSKTMKAVFRAGGLGPWTLTVTKTGNGTVEPWTTTLISDGDDVVVTAEADSGNVFDSWGGDLGGTKETKVITMNGDKTITANFKLMCTLEVFVTPEGWGTVEPHGGTYKEGTVVRLTAEAFTGYTFSTWEGDVSGFTKTTTITMNSDKIVTAEFKANPVTRSYLGICQGMNNQSDTKLFTNMLISPDASPNATFYLDAKNKAVTAHGTWSLLSDGFSTIETFSSSDPGLRNPNYYYESPLRATFLATGTSEGNAIIWTEKPTSEPVFSGGGDNYNLMKVLASENYDDHESGDEVYYRAHISGSGGSYPATMYLYDLNGAQTDTGSGTFNYSQGLLSFYNSTHSAWVRLCPSPANLIVGSIGNDSQKYNFMVGGKEYSLVPGDLTGKHFVGLFMDDQHTAYIAGEGQPSNVVFIGNIDDPGTSSNYSTVSASVELVSENQTGAWTGTLTPAPGGPYSGPYICDTIVTKVGTNEDKLMLCGFVSTEATGPGGSFFHSANFFLIEK